jgi:hypothetical protein
MHWQEVDLSLSQLPHLPAEDASPDAELREAAVIWPVQERSQWKSTPPPAERTLMDGFLG